MEKKFKLPKPFAIQWLEALRSGKYIQKGGSLTSALFVETVAPTNDDLNNYGFCCLGVAGHICGNPANKLTTGFLYSDKGNLENVPEELMLKVNDELENHPFVKVLSNMNDGIYNSSLISGYHLRDDVRTKFDDRLSENKDYRFTFAEIADFIEDNTEFYETTIN